MYYINSKVGRKWELVNSENGVFELCTKKMLKEYINQGIHINGVVSDKKDIIIMPVGSMVNLSRRLLPKNKIITGSSTGISGFDLGLIGGDIIALPLTDAFLNYATENAVNSVFILHIPEIVSRLDNNFADKLNFSNAWYLKLHVELPSSLTSLCCDSVSNLKIKRLYINSKLDKVYCSNPSTSRGLNLVTLSDGFKCELSVKHICESSLDMDGVDVLYLPDTEVLASCSIKGGILYDGIKEFYFGQVISHIGDFRSGIRNLKSPISSSLMRNSSIIYLPNNCNLRSLDFSNNSLFYGMYSSYIFVLSESEFSRLGDVFSKATIRSETAVGVLCYRDEDEYSFIRENIGVICDRYKVCFDTHLHEGSFGSVSVLKLRSISFIEDLINSYKK